MLGEIHLCVSRMEKNEAFNCSLWFKIDCDTSVFIVMSDNDQDSKEVGF